MAPKKRKAKAKRRGVQQATDVITVSGTNAPAREPVDCNDRQGKKHIKRLGKKKKGKRGRKVKPIVVKNIPVDDNGIDESGMADARDNPASTLFNGDGKRMKNESNDAGSEEVTYGDPDVIPENVNRSTCIIDVTCGDNSAILFMKGLSTGSKGACVLFEQNWLTPNEFQYVSGRESAKDWKRSIKHHGKSLKILVSRALMCLKQRRCKCCTCEGRDKEEGSVCSPIVSADQGESVDSGSLGYTCDQSQETACKQKPDTQGDDDKLKDVTTDADTESEVYETPMTDDTETDSQMAADDHISIPSTLSTTENDDSDDDDDDDSSAAEHEAAVTLALARLDVDLNGDSCDDPKSASAAQRTPDADIVGNSGSTLSTDHDVTDSGTEADDTITTPSQDVSQVNSDGDVDNSNVSACAKSQSDTETALSETAQSEAEIEAGTSASTEIAINSPLDAEVIAPFKYDDITPIEATQVTTIDAEIVAAAETGVATAVEIKIITPTKNETYTITKTETHTITKTEGLVPETVNSTPIANDAIASPDTTCTVDSETATPGETYNENEIPLSPNEDSPAISNKCQIANELADYDMTDTSATDATENIDPTESSEKVGGRGKGRKSGRSVWKGKRGRKRKSHLPTHEVMDKQMKLEDNVHRGGVVPRNPIDVNMNVELITKARDISSEANQSENEPMDSSDNDNNVAILPKDESGCAQAANVASITNCDKYAVHTKDFNSEVEHDREMKDKTSFAESLNLTETKDYDRKATTNSKLTSSLTRSAVPKHDIYSLLHSTKYESETNTSNGNKCVYSNEYLYSTKPAVNKATADILSSNSTVEQTAAKPNAGIFSSADCESETTKLINTRVPNTTCEPVVATTNIVNTSNTNDPSLHDAQMCSGTRDACDMPEGDIKLVNEPSNDDAGQFASNMTQHHDLASSSSPTPSFTEAAPSPSTLSTGGSTSKPAFVKQKSKKKGFRLMSIIDGLRTAPKESGTPAPVMSSTTASTALSDSLQAAHKSRKDSAPKQYYSLTTQSITPDSSEPETGTAASTVPKVASTGDTPKVPKHGNYVDDKRKVASPAVRSGVEHRPTSRASDPALSKVPFLPPPMPPFPMLPFGMSVPPALLASMMQSGVPLEWQLALMNRQLGPNELALLTSVMNHQSGFLSGKSESKHIMQPSVSSYRGSSRSSTSSSSKSSSAAAHSRGYSSGSGHSSQTGLTNGRASREYQAAQRTNNSSSSGQSVRASAHASPSRVHPAFGSAGGQSSEHRSYREALSQRAMATMHRAGPDRTTEPSLSWEDLRGGIRPSSSAPSTKHTRTSDALDLTKRYTQAASHQRQSNPNSSQSSHHPKQHGSTGQPLDLSFRK